MNVKQCPRSEQLKRFLLGCLTDEECGEIESHFADCQECFHRAESLDLNDTLSNALATADTQFDQFLNDPADNSPALTVAAVDAKGTHEIDLSFLTPAEGQKELGRLKGYRIIDVIGQGGMGVVLLAEDLHLHRKVALKIIKPEIAADAGIKNRFLREARAAAAIADDHIVTVHHVGEENGVLFLAMQLLQGESLESRLKREGTIPVDQALRIARQTARGLATAHKHGLTHRDIKPDNIWLEAGTDRVKLLDFGLAQVAGEDSQLTNSGVIVGTPQYLAPEQAEVGRVDHRADLFSLGVVLYRMLTGSSPFARPTLLATLGAIGNYTPEPPYTLNQQVPRPVSDLVMRLIEKNPESRVASAAEFIREVETISLQVDALPKSKSQRGSRIRLSVMYTSLAALILLAGVIVTIRDRDGKVLAKFFGDDGITVETVREGNGPPEVPRTPPPSLSGTTDDAPKIAAAVTRLGPLATVQNPPALTSRSGETINQHTLETLPIMGGVASAVSPDGKYVATFSDDGVIRIWNPQTRELLNMLIGQTAGPMRRHLNNTYIAHDGLIWNPDSRRLAVTDQSGEVIVWDAEAAQKMASFRHRTAKINAFLWSPDGSLIAARYEDPVVRVLDAAGNLISELEHPTGVPREMEWAPDSASLAVSVYRDDRLYLWDVRSGKGRSLNWPSRVHPDNNSVQTSAVALAWSPNGQQIAGRCDKTVEICDVASGEIRKVLDHGGTIAWSVDGSELFIGLVTGNSPEDLLQIVRAAGTEKPQRIDLGRVKELHADLINEITPLLDGKHLLIKFHDKGNLLVNLQTGQSRKIGDYHTPPSHFIHSSRDGKVSVVSSSLGHPSVSVMTDCIANDQVRNWNRLPATDYTIQHVDCSDRFIALSGVEHLVITDRNKGLAPARYEQEQRGVRQMALAISPDNKRILSGNNNGLCNIFSLVTSDKLATLNLTFPGSRLFQPFDACYSPDSQEIAVVGRGGLRILKASDGSLQRAWHPENWFHDVAWSPDGKRLAVVNNVVPQQNAYGDFHVKILDAQTGEQQDTLSEFPRTGGTGLHSLTWSRDGRYLAVTGDFGGAGSDADPRWFNQLVVWDVNERKQVLTRPIHAKAIHFINERTLACSTHDGRLIEMDFEKEVVTRDVQMGGVGDFELFTPNGKELLKVNGGRVAIWNAEDGRLKATILSNVVISSRPDSVAISADGHYAGSPDAHLQLRHVVRMKEGTRIFTPFEFQNEFGWKNDPAKARLQVAGSGATAGVEPAR